MTPIVARLEHYTIVGHTGPITERNYETVPEHKPSEWGVVICPVA